MAERAPTLATLRRARKLLSDESRWTQRVHARDARGRTCDPRSAAAVCWCAVGALCRAKDIPLDIANPALDVLAAVIGPGVHVVDWNDAEGRTHADVLAVFDRAIATLEEHRHG